MRGASYARLSKRGRAGREGKSVAEQHEANRREADRAGDQIEHWLTDDEKSASRYRKASVVREDFDKLLGLISRHAIDVVYLFEQSRATREVPIIYELADACEAAGIMLRINGRLLDPSDADDRMMIGMSAVTDAREVDKTRARIVRTMRANAEAGRPHGLERYGYVRIYDERTGAYLRTERDPEQAAIVTEVIHRLAEREPQYQIVADFRRRGVPTMNGGTWQAQQLRRFALNPAYIGLRVHKGAVVGPADWPPIADDIEDAWRRANAILNEPGRRRRTYGERAYLLSGKVFGCGRCGHDIFYVQKRDDSAPGVKNYLCWGCHGVAIRLPVADAYVRALVHEWVSQPENQAMIWTAEADTDSAAGEAWAEVDRLKARLEGFVDQAADGGPDALSPAALARVEARLLPQIQAAQERAERLAAPSAFAATSPATVADDWLAWSGGDDLPRAQLIVTTLLDLTVNPAGRTRAERVPELRIVHRWRLATR